jgi:hypothetical protein
MPEHPLQIATKTERLTQRVFTGTILNYFYPVQFLIRARIAQKMVISHRCRGQHGLYVVVVNVNCSKSLKALITIVVFVLLLYAGYPTRIWCSICTGNPASDMGAPSTAELLLRIWCTFCTGYRPLRVSLMPRADWYT